MSRSDERGPKRTENPSHRWFDEVFPETVRCGLWGRCVHEEQTPYQKIQIIENEIFGRTLLLDGLYMSSEADDFYYHEMLVHPALVTAPRIRRVLVIGGGDGGAIREVLRYPEVDEVVMVEIDARVVEACRRYMPAVGGPAWEDPRLRLIFADAVEWVRQKDPEPFDVIFLDGSDPVGPAKGLFGAAFYRDCARLLAPDGVLTAQSEAPFFMRAVFSEIVRTLRQVFGRAHPYLGGVPLYGTVWSWTYASRRVDPMAIDDARMAHAERFTRCYDREVHRAAFVLPAELRRELA